MTRATLVWIVLLLAATPLLAQEPIEAPICEIAARPSDFNGELVRVRARIWIAFEEFKISADDCDGRKIDYVWLEYGSGPKYQPTIWCCGDLTPRDPLRLKQNEEFKRFHRFLTAQAKKKGCYTGMCHLYEVTATLTGRLDAMPTETGPDGRSKLCLQGGFGHFGFSCSRLVIQSVSQVEAKDVSHKFK